MTHASWDVVRGLPGSLRSALLKPPLPAVPDVERDDESAPAPGVVEMLTAFGVAMLQAAEPTSDVKVTLERIAAAYGIEHLTVVVLPTVVMVQVAGSPDLIRIENADTATVRLDQAAAISLLASKAVAGVLEPRLAVRELERIRRSEPRFGPVVTVLGHSVLSVGFGLTLHPTAAALPAYAVLGLVVGVFVLAARRVPTLASAAPVAAAFLVTVLTTRLLSNGIGDDPRNRSSPDHLPARIDPHRRGCRAHEQPSRGGGQSCRLRQRPAAAARVRGVCRVPAVPGPDGRR